ncbi:hypothetical protein [Bacillus massilinigeriensis]|uniref:hypothetical protein n=1 Tax=Bacillus mediterraneensis TaxID=1805474 RepID=UPI0008F8F5F8|nr:hypothetical protein [Bacillus mediterraneensis]
MKNKLLQNDIYDIIYDNTCFPYLQFIRVDQICGIRYVTMQSIVTGEMFTFEQGDILHIKRINKIEGEQQVDRKGIA